MPLPGVTVAGVGASPDLVLPRFVDLGLKTARCLSVVSDSGDVEAIVRLNGFKRSSIELLDFAFADIEGA